MGNYIGISSNSDLDKVGKTIGGGIAGTLSKPVITYNAGTLTIGEGRYRFNTVSGFKGNLVEHTIPESTLVLADDTPSFLVANYNDGTPAMTLITDLSTVNWGLNVPVNIVYADNGVFSIIDGDETGNGLANKIQSFFFSTQSYVAVSGELNLSEDTGRIISISAGTAWLAGSVEIQRLEARSDNGDAYLRINNGDTTYTRTPFSSYPNTQYDDKSGALQTLTDGNYGVIWVWRCMSIDCVRMHIMLGNGDYDLNQAKTSQPPEHPPVLNTNAMLIGRIIVLKGATTATQIDSAFDTQFSASTTTSHGGLTHLTGGHNGVYDHLPVYKDDETTPILTTDKVNGKLLFGSGSSEYDESTDTLSIGNIDSPISNYLGNGVLTGFIISINADTTKIDISSGVGNIIDHSDITAPVWSQIEYAGGTAITLTNLAIASATYLAIDAGGNVVQQITPFTATQRGSGLIVIGAAIHSNRTNVNVVNNLPDVVLDELGQLNELLDSLHNFNVEGNVFSANGANFNINKSVGTLFKRGCNFENDTANPHVKELPALVAPTNLRYRLQDGTEYADTAIIDHLNYDNGGVLTPVPNHDWTVQRITIFSSNIVRIQYGQHLYNTASDAIQGVEVDDFVIESNIADNGLLRCLLIVGEDATDLSSAIFLQASKFGDTESTGSGSAITNLQQAYNNSGVPEILTDATNGAVSIKQGSGADTDTVLEILNGVGSATASISGDGDITTSGDISLDNAHGYHIEDTLGTSIQALQGSAADILYVGAQNGWTGGMVLQPGSNKEVTILNDGSVEAKGDIIAKSFGSKLMKVSGGLFETAVVGTEYYSPDQHGGIYGTVYRQYHGAKTDGQTITTTGITKLVLYGGTINGDNCYFGATTGSTGLVNAWGSTNIIQFTISNWTVNSGWVDYTK